MIKYDENTTDSYQSIFNNTGVYSPALSCTTIRNKRILNDDSYAII